MEITNYNKKEMTLLANKNFESCVNQKSITFAKKMLEYTNDINLVKLEIIAVIQVNRDVLHITYVIWYVKHLKKFM